MHKKTKIFISLFYTILVFIQSAILILFILSITKSDSAISWKSIFILIEGLFFFNLTITSYIFPSFKIFSLWNYINNIKIRKLLFILVSSILICIILLVLTVNLSEKIILSISLPLIYFFTTYFFHNNIVEEAERKRLVLNLKDLLALLLIIFFSLLSIAKIGSFMSVDEPKWIKYRIPQYFSAWSEPNLQLTNINDKPGILPTILAGKFNNTEDQKIRYWAATPNEMITLTQELRIPITVFVSACLALLYLIVRDIYSQDLALIYLALLTISPPLIGISRIINPDATVWITLTIFLFSFIGANKKNDNNYYILSGVFLGLAFLSKFTAVPFLVLPLIYIGLTTLKNKQSFYQQISGFIFSITLALLTYLLLNPYTLYDFTKVFDLTFFIQIQEKTSLLIIFFFLFFTLLIEFFSKSICSLTKRINWEKLENVLLISISILFTTILLLDLTNSNIFNLNDYFSKARITRSSLDNLLHNISIQIYTHNTITILLIILLPILKIFRSNNNNKKETEPILETISFIIYFITFLLSTVLFTNIVLPVRYEIHLYPLIIFIVAYLLFHLQYNLWYKKILILITFILLSFFDLQKASPYYLNFQNLLKINPSNQLTESWGFGGYEIAQYIQANIPKDSKIWSDREGVCEFVDNYCEKRKWNPFAKDSQYDYLILTETGYNIIMGDKEVNDNTELKNTWEIYYNKKTPIYETYVNNNKSLHFKIQKIDDSSKKF